ALSSASPGRASNPCSRSSSQAIPPSMTRASVLNAVRAGGHSISGKSTCGLVIDVSPMQGVRVDPDRRVARMDGGGLLRHLDRETPAPVLSAAGARGPE